jgi:lipopolysaccharide transport system ATP-binding protein
MSSELAIETRGLSKEYVIGERGLGFVTLRDEIDRVARRLVRARGLERPRANRIWALDEVSFAVERGSAVGVIGHNGAGKTTLLKILSRITAPTRGEARITGHVGSLLEVGTGFHPELTGRENVFLNGAILGMGRREIRSKFDEIVAFAEVERFIDTPVKRYSSGMYVRLAFAVAAHLEPDILIVDEVLAVGDAAFQRKCLGKMDEASTEGRTVLFVSHNMAAIRSLTTKSIWLDHGHVAGYGPTGEIVSDYLALTAGADASAVVDLTGDELRVGVRKWTAQLVRFDSLALLGEDGEPRAVLPEAAPFRFDIAFTVRRPIRFIEVAARVKTMEGARLFSLFSGQHEGPLQPGRYRATCDVPENVLRPGRYVIELAALGADPQDIVPSALVFEVAGGHREETNPLYVNAVRSGDGFIRVDSRWSAIAPATAPVDEPSAAARD